LKGDSPMTTLTQAQVASALAIPQPEVLMLARNISFPRPTTVGAVLMWDATAVSTFQTTLWAPAIARGWRPVASQLASFPFGTAAAANPGPSYKPEGSAAPELFDL
jgi:hypothetical protein